ncbi:NIPSNAP family protein [Actinoplanes italicus]|uniref:NIPSNAP protein n=1 Tax=Actinoplanes italicus TaxID=113567 RepID=A0A2T0JYS4_9ACTN|nr:NIPSNAP family protein [Actinoplanes italicus]PRX14677.1 NIPSNAP protein [Actinoplanes italicus]GIE34541.1 NIPSNAP family protein [Actinoplanes italicus]
MIVELRQYTLRPGRRDDLVELFDAEFVESQEELGMAVLGQFRDLDDPDRFVWLRGFADMGVRLRGLQEFYGGPVWKEHGPAANDTMVDSDDVLLLRALVPPPATAREGGRSEIKITIWYAESPFDDTVAGLVPDAIAAFTTEYAANDFPALPVREGEHAFVWLTRDTVDVEPPDGLEVIRTERLRLHPTARSGIR